MDKKYKENDAEFARVAADMSAKNNRRKKVGDNVTSEKKKVYFVNQNTFFLIHPFCTARGDGWSAREKPERYQ